MMASCPNEKCCSISSKYSFTFWPPNRPIKASSIFPFSVLSLMPFEDFSSERFFSEDLFWLRLFFERDLSFPSPDFLHFLSSFSHFLSHLSWNRWHFPPKTKGWSVPVDDSLWTSSHGLRFMFSLTTCSNSSGFLWRCLAIFSHRNLMSVSSWPFSLAYLLMSSNLLRVLLVLANSSYFWGSPPNILDNFLVALSSFPHFSALVECDLWPWCL